MRPEAERLLAKIDAGEVALDDDGALWLRRALDESPELACDAAGHIYTKVHVTEGGFARGACILCGDILVGSSTSIANIVKTRCACGHRGSQHQIEGACNVKLDEVTVCGCDGFLPAELDAAARKADACDYQTGHDLVEIEKAGAFTTKMKRCTKCGTEVDDGIPF